jgi:hypothetical protein
VIAAGWYLTTHSSRNWLRGVVRRLRSPRYAVALLLGLAYLSLVYLSQQSGSGLIPASALALGGTLFLGILVVKWWVFGADRLALALSPAEIQFFFPAPVTRRALLIYKLLRAQRVILISVLLWTFLLRRGQGFTLGVLPYALSLWVFFSTLFFHRLGVALTRDTLFQHGPSGVRRSWPVLVILGTLIVTLSLTLQRLPLDSSLLVPEGPQGALETLFETPPFAYLAWPLRIPLRPLEATTLADWVMDLSAAGMLLALHVVWILRADRSFEDAAVEASARRAELLARWKSQGRLGAPSRVRWGWLRLPMHGTPVGAIVWKNVTRLLRTITPALLITMVVLVSIAVFVSLTEDQKGTSLKLVGTMAIGWAAALALFGSQWIRIDLRGELEHLATLKAWPLSGLAIMTGQVFSSAVVLALLEAILTTFGLAMLAYDPAPYMLPSLLSGLALTGWIVLIPLNSVSVAIQNGAALLFPAWVRTDIRPGGIEQIGQHLLTAGVSLLVLLLALLGPALAGGAVGYLLWARLQEWALVPGGLLTAAGLALETFLLLEWLGARFERLEPSELHLT